MTNGEKILLAMMLLKYLAHEDMTHHCRRILAQIAYDLIVHNDTPITAITVKNTEYDIPF